jgi:hypothetical protein
VQVVSACCLCCMSECLPSQQCLFVSEREREKEKERGRERERMRLYVLCANLFALCTLSHGITTIISRSSRLSVVLSQHLNSMICTLCLDTLNSTVISSYI